MNLSITENIVITWLIVLPLISGTLFSVIHHHISNKAPISQTIIDLIYKDLVVYLFLITSNFCIVQICLLNSPGYILEFPFALLCGLTNYYFFISISILMSISSFLRIISYVGTSEAAGIQLLGPDDMAIILIRVSTVIATSITLFVALAILKSVPPNIVLFIDTKNWSIVEILKIDFGSAIYLVFPAIAVILNCAASIVIVLLLICLGYSKT